MKKVVKTRQDSGAGLLFLGLVVVCLAFSLFPQLTSLGVFAKSLSNVVVTPVHQATIWAVSKDGKSVPVPNRSSLAADQLLGFSVTVLPATGEQIVPSLVQITVDTVKVFSNIYNDKVFQVSLEKGKHLIQAEGSYQVCRGGVCGIDVAFDPVEVQVEVK